MIRCTFVFWVSGGARRKDAAPLAPGPPCFLRSSCIRLEQRVTRVAERVAALSQL